MSKFITPDNLFSWILPSDWSEYEDGDGSYAFFNTISWTGNFRIAPIKFNTKYSVESTISEEVADNANAAKVFIGAYECAFYKRDIIQGDDNLVIYYWLTGRENYLFTCSFTFDKDQESSNESQLKLVESIIESIRFN